MIDEEQTTFNIYHRAVEVARSCKAA